MFENLKGILNDFENEIKNIISEKELNTLKIKYIGKSGILTECLKALKDIEKNERKAYGEAVNKLKKKIEFDLDKFLQELDDIEIKKSIETRKLVDLTVPFSEKVGSLHPITITTNKVIEIFKSMGFGVEDGFEIETEFNCFEAVNVPKNHPARDMQDTFYLENGEVLKTHTSASQNRIMKKYNAPLKTIFPGRCFRNEELDASHENTFFQIEGMMIDENVSIANLIYFMKEMLSKVFGKKIKVRLRPGFFPFVEPGFELDCNCPFCEGRGCNVCKHTGWVELCPCGMIHPKVLEMGGIDIEKYQGFAFGLGLSRLAMMTFNIDDIRKLNSGNITALRQAKIR